MAIKRTRRGISIGTVFMLSLTVVTLLTGAVILSRLSGNMGPVTIDPKLLTEPLNVLARTITDTEPNAQGAQQQQAGTPVQTDGAGLPAATLAPTPTPAPTVPPSQILTLTAVGQVTLGSELQRSGQGGSTGFGFDDIIAPVASAMGADLSFATLRMGLSRDINAYGTYCGPQDAAAALKNAGVNVLNLATDRLFDRGVTGLSETRSILTELGISQAGAYLTASERQEPSIVDINGVKVGVLAYTGQISSSGKKAASQVEIAAGTRLLDVTAATSDIQTLRARGADLIIVLAHWGERSDTKVTKTTRDTATALANAGADIILGTNPTTVHEMERRTVTDASGASREVFIAYSLGNFLIDDSRDTGDITGVILRLRIEWNFQAKRAVIEDAVYMPTWIMRWKDSAGINRFRVVPAGITTIPDNMTDSIYLNMKKAYQNMATKLGSSAARPVME